MTILSSESAVSEAYLAKQGMCVTAHRLLCRLHAHMPPFMSMYAYSSHADGGRPRLRGSRRLHSDAAVHDDDSLR